MSKKRRDKLMKDWEHVSHEDFVRWLDASGLSQAELSRELGVSKVTISNWKAGRRVPKESRQKQLAAVVAEGQRRSTFDKERFRAWRKAQGLTQKELAERLGVSVGSINGWERGKTQPSAATRRRVDEVLRQEAAVAPRPQAPGTASVVAAPATPASIEAAGQVLAAYVSRQHVPLGTLVDLAQQLSRAFASREVGSKRRAPG